MLFKSIFPYTQQEVAEYPLMNDREVELRIAKSEAAFKTWKQFGFDKRATVFLNAAKILIRDRDLLARLITTEMGKVLSESEAEIEKCAYVCKYYAENTGNFLKDELYEAGFAKSFVSYEPVGAVLGIMPWNFPFWQVFRYAAPTLMAGNVSLLKHAPNVCGCAKKIEEILVEAGAPAGVFQALIIETDAVEKIIAQRIVQGVTLTGSERAGSSVASHAGKNIKKSVMELGGSDALIVLQDADMKKAAATALQSRMQNAGQSCIGAKRFIVTENAEADFLNEITRLIKGYTQGDPFDSNTKVGPMARPDLTANLETQLLTSVAAGAHLAFGGLTAGCNFSPALLLKVQRGMPAFEQETFGPLASVITVKTEGEAVELANATDYGLGAGIWTRDIEKGMALARRIESGSVFINAMVKSDPKLPFGGIKKSGYGRELGRHGQLEFVNIKTIAVSV